MNFRKLGFVFFLMFSVFFTLKAQNIENGLIAYYPFNGNANDESGNGLNLTIYGATLTADRFGNPNSAYSFDGIGNYLENVTGLQGVTNQVSVSLWFYKPDFWEDEYQRILVTGSDATAGQYGIILGQGPSTGTDFQFFINSTDSRVYTSHPSVNAWHHVVGTYDGLKTKLYIDNNFIGEKNYTSDVNVISPLRIGWFVNDNFFKGLIDDIRIYNRALTDSEVKELYNETLSGGLIGYYPFNGNANDESGNGLNLTIYGATLTTDRFDNPNSAYSFDGIGNYLENFTGLQGVTNQVSVSLWFYKPDFWEDEYQRILVTGSDATAGQYGIILGQGPSTGTDFQFFINSTDSRVYTSHPSVNAWHHVVGTYDGLKTKLYIDNNFIGENNYTSNVNVISPLRIGWFVNDSFFKGLIDDIRIYDRPLSEFEIQQLFEKPNPATKSLTLLTPNGGENWTAGSIETISWSSNNLENINLEFSSDNGLHWNTIESNIPAVNSSYDWQIPNISSSECLVKAVNSNDPNLYDISDASFTILDQIITSVIQSDSVWYDPNYDGTELGVVDASGSTINFGSIVSYIWTVGNDTVGYGANPTIELSSGTNELVLRLESDLGKVENDTVYISVFAAVLKTNGAILSSVSQLDDRSLFISSTDDRIYKFDSTGTVQWTILTGGSIQSTICVSSENNIYVGSTDTRLYAFDNLGTPRWDKAMGGIILSSPSTGPLNTVILGLSSGRLFALEENGQILWNFQAGGAIISSPSLTNDRIFFGCTDKKVYSVSFTGNILNTFETQDSILSSPALSQDSSVIIGGNDGYLYSLDKNLNLIWKYYTLGKIKSSPVIDDMGNIYVGSSSGFVYAVSKNKNLLWKYNAGSPVNGNPTLGPDGSIYIGCDNGKFLVLDNNGNLKWYLQTGAPVVASALVTNSGLIYLGGTDGKVYIIKDSQINLSKKASGSNFQWPTFKGNNRRTGFIDDITDVKNSEKILPSKYSLYQNYPNPFNPTTKIKYSLPYASDVELSIYNLVGQKVQTLFKGTHNAGFYELNFNASNLASGVYLLTFKAKSVDGNKTFNKTDKILLLK